MENRTHKIICEDCMGNGYIRIDVLLTVKLDNVAHVFRGRNSNSRTFY
jgi:hypothetical protein